MLQVADFASVGAWNPLCDLIFCDPRVRAAVAGRLPDPRGFACALACPIAPGIPRPLGKGRSGALTEAKQLHAQAGDGLDGLYRRYAVWLARRLRARLGPEEAADVVQETYIRIAPYAQDGIRHPRAFLLRVALNLVRDASRRDARRSNALLVPGSDVETPSQIDQLMLSQIVQAMPPLYRDVFVLSRFDGMTYVEIAETLDISTKTVEWRMSKALDYCAARLDL